MKPKLFSRSSETWDAMLEEIRGAQSSVYLEMYIFLHDTFPTHNFTELLCQKARDGVSVKMVVDALGSYTLESAAISDLYRAGVDLVFFGKFWRRTHRKILVVDEKVGFIGGVNIGKEYHSWLDLQIRLTGPVVLSLVRSFQKSYTQAGGADNAFLQKSYPSPIAEASVRLLERFPGKRKNQLRAHYRSRIRNARKSITIITPYFIPHGWMAKDLKSAAARGIAVEVIVSEKTSPFFAAMGNRLAIASLAGSGIQFYFTREIHHAKALLIDDREGMVGSPNIDALSFDHNLEAGVFFEDKGTVRELREVADKWKKDAALYEPKLHAPPWYIKLLEPLFSFIHPIL